MSRRFSHDRVARRRRLRARDRNATNSSAAADRKSQLKAWCRAADTITETLVFQAQMRFRSASQTAGEADVGIVQSIPDSISKIARHANRSATRTDKHPRNPGAGTERGAGFEDSPGPI
jgi:hypothetical protein